MVKDSIGLLLIGIGKGLANGCDHLTQYAVVFGAQASIGLLDAHAHVGGYQSGAGREKNRRIGLGRAGS